MCVEIEAKLKVDSLAEVKRRLAGLGAEFVAEQLQTDSLLDDADGTLATSDRCLRIRRHTVAGSDRFFLCYKVGREEKMEVADADSLLKLFAALGYEEKLVVEKKRCLWRLAGCEVALDELPLLGDFVEIEGPDDERIADVQARLGLAKLPHVAKSYAHLIEEELGRRGA